MRLLLLSLLLASCGGALGPGAPSPTPPAEVRAAAERVDVEGRSYSLQADLYRDLMPGPAPTPKRGVGGTLFLRASVESDVPQGLRAGRAWLIKVSETWETVPQALQTLTVDRRYHLSLGVRDGPTWDAGSRVDVVLEFEVAGRTYYVRQPGVEIIGAL